MCASCVRSTLTASSRSHRPFTTDNGRALTSPTWEECPDSELIEVRRPFGPASLRWRWCLTTRAVASTPAIPRIGRMRHSVPSLQGQQWKHGMVIPVWRYRCVRTSQQGSRRSLEQRGDPAAEARSHRHSSARGLGAPAVRSQRPRRDEEGTLRVLLWRGELVRLS